MKKLYVKNDDGSFEEVSALLAGHGIKPIIKTTIDEAIKKYIKNCTAQKCLKNQSSEKLYFGIFKDFLHADDLTHIDQVTREHIDRFESKLLKKMKPTSVNRRFCGIKNFFRKCLEWELIVDNPCKGFGKRKFEKNPFKPWTQEMFDKFIAISDGDFKNVFNFLWLTGCRPIEAKNLRWTDIDYDENTLVLKCGKNAQVSRKFPITEKLSKFLHSLRMNGAFVFADKNKRQLNADNLYHHCKKRLNRLGYMNYTVYGIRHGFGTRLAKMGVNSFYIAELMGHADLKTTRGYVHFEKNVLIEILNKAK